MKINLSPASQSLIHLVMRSRDIGDGWRQCSKAVYDAVVEKAPDDLFEKDDQLFRVRFTVAAQTLVKYTK